MKLAIQRFKTPARDAQGFSPTQIEKMKSKLKRENVLDEGDCPNPKQPGPQGAAILVLLSFVTSSIFSPLFSLTEHSGPSVTFQANNLKKGVGAAATISGNGNIDASATYKNANVASISGNLHDPSSFGNFTVNDQFQQQVNQNAALEKADANLEAGKAKLEQGRNAIAASGNDYQREVLRNENTSAQDKHDVLVTIGKSNELTMDPSSASTWLGRTTQDVVGSFLGSTGLGASDSTGFIDKNGEYVQRFCFTAGTLIRTKEGFKPIEKIELGDEVLSLNAETGKLSYNKVTSLFEKEAPEIYRITYEDGQVINTTWNHPFYVRGKGFVQVKNIERDARSVTVASIRNSYRIERSSGISIGASLASIGSKASSSNTASWKEEISGTVGIVKIEVIQEKTKVYNFEVEDNHTYFVGKDGVLVHNSDCKGFSQGTATADLSTETNGISDSLHYTNVGKSETGYTTWTRSGGTDTVVVKPDGTLTRYYGDAGGNRFETSIGEGGKGEESLRINGKDLNHGDVITTGSDGKMLVLKPAEIPAFIRNNNIHDAVVSINGRKNTGSDATGMFSSIRDTVAGNGTQKPTFHIYNSERVTSSTDGGDDWLGNRDKPTVQNTLSDLIDSGAFSKGGMIIGHSAGAHNVEEAIRNSRTGLENTRVITFGGAHGQADNFVVRSWTDFYNSGDKVRRMGYGREGSKNVPSNPNRNNYQLIENTENKERWITDPNEGMHHNFNRAYNDAFKKCVAGSLPGC